MTVTFPRNALLRRTRLRLWLQRRVDLTASWLAGRGHWRMAELVWRLCGMW